MAKRKQPETIAAPPTGPRTTEDLDDATLQALAFRHKDTFDKLDAEAEDLARRRKAAKAAAKSDMGADALDVIEDLQELETEDGEKKLTAAVRRILRSAQWAGVALGTQFDAFDFNAPDRRPAEDRAHDLGRVAGAKGEVCKPPYDDPNSDVYKRWITGWQAGQEALLRAKLKTMPPAESGEPTPLGGSPESTAAVVKH